jgi:hypothetical protein
MIVTSCFLPLFCFLAVDRGSGNQSALFLYLSSCTFNTIELEQGLGCPFKRQLLYSVVLLCLLFFLQARL